MRKGTITRYQDNYYILTWEGNQVGGQTKGILERYAKKIGVSVTYQDKREKPAKVFWRLP